jgi:hypothetical protein
MLAHLIGMGLTPACRSLSREIYSWAGTQLKREGKGEAKVLAHSFSLFKKKVINFFQKKLRS